MPPRLSWSHLIPGIVALAALAAIVIGVLMFAGVGRVRGETIRLHVLTDQARGVMQGTEVWLDGQKVGVVHDVGFRQPSADTLHRVVVSIDVKQDDAAVLRQDSRIRVRPGGNVIGPVVVFLESGTPSGQPVRDGDTLRALAQSDAEVVMERLGSASEQLPALMADVRTVIGHVRNRNGTVGAFLAHGIPSGDIARLRGNVAALRAQIGGATGPGELPALMRRARAAMARSDSVRALLAAPGTSLGRFRRDSTLRDAVAGIVAEFDTLQRDLAESPGTLSRLRSDSALHFAMLDARAQMTLLFADMRRRPLRYIHF